MGRVDMQAGRTKYVDVARPGHVHLHDSLIAVGMRRIAPQHAPLPRVTPDSGLCSVPVIKTQAAGAEANAPGT